MFVRIGGKCYWHLSVETNDAAKYTTMHGMAAQYKELTSLEYHVMMIQPILSSGILISMGKLEIKEKTEIMWLRNLCSAMWTRRVARNFRHLLHLY